MRLNDIPGSSSPQVDRVLLARIVAGEASPADAAAVERWVAEDPAHGLELAALRRIWARAGVLPSGVRLDELWRELRQQMHEDELEVQKRPPLRLLQPHRPRRWPWMVGALTAAGVAAVAAGLALRSGRLVPAAPLSPLSEQAYGTARGQHSTVELTDGSRVQLGPDSRIRVRLHEGGRREVTLDGEAVFDVVHDERRPFVVHARNAVTEDLGTMFGVRAYSDDRRVRVVVVSGRVALRPARAAATVDGGREYVLAARDVGEVGLAGEVIVHHSGESVADLAWTHDRVVFRDAPLGEIAAWLERWYDVTVAIPDSAVAARRLTLDLAAPSLGEVLDAIVVPMGLRYARGGRQITLHR